MTQGQYVAAAYAVVFVVVLAYVAIIAAKLARLQRQVAELLELAQRRQPVVQQAGQELEDEREPAGDRA